MQNKTIRVLLLTVVLSLTGCSVVEGIFKAGMGYFYSNRILAIILFIVSKLFKKETKYFVKKTPTARLSFFK
jgi:hypothetical protein